MNKTRKLVFMRVLKIIFYCLGFPLLLFFVLNDSRVFMDQDIFTGTAMNGFWLIFGLWAASALIQIGLSLTVKNSRIRTIITIIVAFAILLIPSQIIDASLSKQYDEVREQNAKYGVTVEDFNKQAQWYNTLSDKESYSDELISNVNRFIDVYGLNGYYADTYRTITQVNTLAVDKKGKAYSSDKDAEKLLKNGDFLYNPNGMLYDGYIFGVENAIDLLIKYNEFRAKKYIASEYYYTGKEVEPTLTANEALADAIERAESSKEWNDYINSEEYKKNLAEAQKYYLTEPRLSDLLNALVKGIGENSTVGIVLGLITKFGIDLDLPYDIDKILEIIGDDDKNLTLDEVTNTVYLALTDMTQKHIAMRDSLNAESTPEEWAAYEEAVMSANNIKQTLASVGITDLSSAEGIKNGIMDLLGEISFYQHPLNKMSWDFMDEADKEQGLDEYAWVKYHCEKFGRIAGCVLAPTDAPLVGNTVGNGTNAEEAFTLEELYQLRADLSYQPSTYPLLSARRYMNIWYGILALSLFLTAVFAQKEQDIRNDILGGMAK